MIIRLRRCAYLIGGEPKKKDSVLVEPDRKKSNQLVEVLQDWALIFKAREQRLSMRK